MPRVVHVDPIAPDVGAIAEAARVLREGELVAFPTETVYGLGARALDPSAIARIFAAKGRPTHHPLIAHAAGEDDARALAASWPDAAARLARAFWPGPLTLVVERASFVPDAVSGGSPSIALRVPAHPVARALIVALGEAVAAPSANRYQGLSPTRAAHVVAQLGDAVGLVLDGGACDAGIESTVVDVREGAARVLRPGAVGLAELRAVVPDLLLPDAVAAPSESRASPGMDARHYAPRARLLLARSASEAAARARSLVASGAGVVAVVACGDADADVLESSGVVVRRLPADPAAYARRMYETLHELDGAGVAAIVVEAVPDDEAWCAVADRLRRGATAQ